MRYPKMHALRQSFDRVREEDVRGAVTREIDRLAPQLAIKRGARVAITVGSRGIRNIAAIARAVVDRVKSLGGQPFIFPAMGSHAGATAEGQAAVLHHFGVTEEAMGCRILSGMAAVQIGQSKEGIPVFLDKHASEADHVVVLALVRQIKDRPELEIRAGPVELEFDAADELAPMLALGQAVGTH